MPDLNAILSEICTILSLDQPVYGRIMISTLPVISTRLRPLLVSDRGSSCLNNAHQLLRLSSWLQERAGKECTEHTAYACLAWDARVTTTQNEGCWRFQTEVELIVSYRCSKLIIACLIVEITQCWFVFLCQATVTLHQGQCHQQEHEHVCHA